jgi:hypothetical protein
MAMWHDIAPESEDDYNAWHTIEHMPERLGIPGFLRGRRGVNWDLDRHRYLTVYESESLASLSSHAYLERLNNPTEWTSRVAPAFRNFLRVACETAHSVGNGVGGAIGTYRIDLPNETDAEAWVSRLAMRLADLMDLPGVCGVHTAIPRPAHSDIPTTETRIRPEMAEKTFDALLMVETIGPNELADADPQVRALLGSERVSDVASHQYSMAFLLGRNGDS